MTDIMTLRQLLANTPFDGIAPYIMQGEHPEDVCAYKQAYDILLHTPPCNDGCRKVYVCKEKESDGSEYIDASHVEGQNWATYIDGEVVVEDGIDVPDTWLAYKLLWHLTYFGFSLEENRENLSSLRGDGHRDNQYGHMARAVEIKRYMLWANKAIRKRIRESIAWHEARGEHNLALTDDDWNYIHKRETHRNRMKRMRDHRLEKRYNQLENFEHCENTVQELLGGQNEVTRAALSFLWSENGRSGCEFQTRSYDVSKRLGYLDELITKYEAMTSVKGLKQMAVKITTSPKHPLTQEEMERIKQKVVEQTGCPYILYIIGVSDRLGEEIHILMVGPK